MKRLIISLMLLCLLGASFAQGQILWTPANITVQAWWDASDTSTVLTNGTAVTNWMDKSGNGLHLSQTTNATLQPVTGATISNGLNAINFTGDLMETASNPFGATVSNAFVIAVHKVESTQDGAFFSLTGSSTNANRWQSNCPWGDGNVVFDCGGALGTNRVSASYGVSAGSNALVSFYCSKVDNVQQIYKNGTLLVGDTTGHAVNTVTNITVGGSDTSYQDTTIGEFIIINSTVNTTTRQKMEGYLAHKWGLTANLPSDHPYKSLPPIIPQRWTLWTPSNLTTVAWYDAADTSKIIATNSTIVTNWMDKSGNNLHLSQTTNATLQPTTGATINGLNAIDFNVDRMETAINPFSPTVSNAFVIAVHKVDVVANGTFFSLTASGLPTNRWHSHAPWGDGTLYFDCGGQNPPYRVSATYGVSTGSSVLVSFYCSTAAAVQQVHKNGTLLVGDSTGHAVATLGNITVGGAGTDYQDTTLGEFIIINGTVDAATRQKLEGYLAYKWGLTANLPTTHPYKSVPPLIPPSVMDIRTKPIRPTNWLINNLEKH